MLTVVVVQGVGALMWMRFEEHGRGLLDQHLQRRRCAGLQTKRTWRGWGWEQLWVGEGLRKRILNRCMQMLRMGRMGIHRLQQSCEEVISQNPHHLLL